MKMLKKVYESRMNAKREAQMESIKKHRKEIEKVEAKRLQKSKEAKKIIYRRLGKIQNAKSRRNNSNQNDD